jgi:DNA-binding NarL/FixJ family response regulator
MAFGIKMCGRVRVAVIDDDANMRLFFQDILQANSRFYFVGGYSTATEALTEIPIVKPDLTLIDIRLPDSNGVEVTKRLKQLMPGLRIIIVTGTHHESWVGASLNAGAAAYLLKPVLEDQLLATLEFNSLGLGRMEGREIEGSPHLVNTDPLGLNLPLTLREKDVLRNLAKGLLYKEISEILGLSYTAVHKCLNSIYKKLHVNNRSEAIRKWFSNGGV